MKILLVEDDERLSRSLVRLLVQDRHNVEIAPDGETGLDIALGENGIDVVILDLGLPDISGLEVARRLRSERRELAILILTARDDETDKVTGLELGADDYVVKPFSPKELVARVRAVLRRSETPPASGERIVVGDLDVDLARRRVVVAGRRVSLTPTEFELLVTLAREPGRVWTRAQLLDAVHGFSLETYERAIDGHVRNLRRKLEPVPAEPRYVRTVHGVGYALAEPAE
jgi:two-component system OmpR family response regulator